MICLIKDSRYRTKLAQSGISESDFDAFVGDYVEQYGEYPNLDEIPFVDSSHHLKDLIELDEFGGTQISKILQVTQAENLEQANVILNDEYSDLEIYMLPLSEEAHVEIKNRPSEYREGEVQDVDIDDDINTSVVFSGIFDNLRNLYGIDLISITDKEISLNEDLKNIPEVLSAKAFVHNGKIYINTDRADIDAPIHEMTHMLLGSIRFKNPDLYFDLIENAQNFEIFSEMVRQNPNKTMSDILEETFVEEISRYLAGLPSAISELDNKILHKLHYNINRLLDSVLMGQYSVKSIDDASMYNMSLKDLAKMVNSSVLNTTSVSSLDDGALHRMLSNEKSDLIRQGYLEEYC